MKEKIPSSIEDKILKQFQFDVNTPQFMKEACENCDGGMYAVCWNVFRELIAMVAQRATEINDPLLNILMLRLNLYEMPNEERVKCIERITKEWRDDQ